MRSILRLAFTAFLLTMAVSLAGAEARAELDAAAVRNAIDRAIKYLKIQQKPDGGWPAYSQAHAGGASGLCTLALLESGVEVDDPVIERALGYLRKLSPETTYAVSFQTMALCRAGDEQDLALIRRNVRWLSQNQIREGKPQMHGAWAYPRGSGDASNAQMAVLALHEAALRGVEVKDQTWKAALGYWQRAQNPDGSWGYTAQSKAGRGSMTCAGIASVVIAQLHLDQADSRVTGGECRCERQADDEIVRKGLEWLGNHFAVTHHPAEDMGANIFHYYYLYGVERVGRMTAQRFFVKSWARAGAAKRHDWYREGADYLVGSQNRDGSWRKDAALNRWPHVGTSMSLLFLSKGLRPVLVSKLQRKGNDWQRLRHDMANLTRYAEQQWKLPLTWQVIDSRTATVEDYAQTPVLFISGEDDMKFDAEQVKTLRDYVENGGFIFADACCGDGDFDESFRELMRRVFPEPELRLQPLDPEHPIWSTDETPNPKYVHPDGRWLEGINFGCRTSVVYSPDNLSCFWELAGTLKAKRYGKEVRAEIEACRAVGLNVLAYATNRKPRDKMSIPRPVQETEEKHPTDRGHLAVAKLRHAGGCDAAPRALANLMTSLEGELEIRAARHPKLIAITDEIFDYHFLFLHGRHDFRLNDKEVVLLRTFVERGGLIFADSICGSEKFAKAMRREMGRLFPENKMEPIPSTDPILTPAYGGADLSQVQRREAFRDEDRGRLEMQLKEGPPMLEGMVVEDRYGIIFSPLDLSCALELQSSPQCRGYVTDDAKRISINVILYSLHE